ncbi:MAG: ECF-type sigma factor [Holophagales bacterium]|nr:ECF-type sigma factor [Holophagales bacterium]
MLAETGATRATENRALPLDSEERGEITRLLQSWQDGDAEPENRLMELVYQELRQQADRYLSRERSDHTLEPRALVHEAYLRLRSQRHVHWRNRKHFFAVAAITMRRILLDHARTKLADRRSGDVVRFEFLDHLPGVLRATGDLTHLRLALGRLSELDPRLSLVVNLHCFAGLTLDEAAEAIGRSRRTVARDWALARAWLVKELGAA